MNILILAPFLPWPLDQGGKIRIFNIIKNLATTHTVSLAALVSDRDRADAETLREFCAEVVTIARPARPRGDGFAFFTSALPYNVIRYDSPEMRRALRDLLGRQRFDLIQVEFSFMWPYAGLFPEIPVVLDAHNIEYRNIGQIGDAAPDTLRRLLYRVEERRLRRVEERAWRECALCLAVSEEERSEIAGSIGASRVVTVPNGVDPERFAFVRKEGGGRSILLLGGMDYLPNRDAVTHFLRDIFPLVRSTIPDATVDLVGRQLGQLPEGLAEQPGVRCHESVPDVLPFFRHASLLAVPLRQGAGTRIKVLEAMAAGLPVVTTAKGCEGIGVRDGEHLLVGTTPEAFAAAVSRVLRDPELAGTLATNARHLVEERYTWGEIVRRMEDWYTKAFSWPQIEANKVK